MRAFIPGKAPIIIAVVGTLVAGLGAMLALLMGLDSPGQAVSMAGMGVGLFAVFPMIMAIGVAGVVEDKAAAKAVLFGLGAALALPMMIAVSFGMTGQDNSAGNAIGGGVCCSAPFFIGMLVPALIYGFKAPSDMRESGRRDLAAALAIELGARGEVHLERFASQQGLDLQAVRGAAELLRDAPNSDLMMDPGDKLLFLRSTFEENKARLTSLLQLQGRLTIAAASQELRASPEQVREMVHALVQEGRFDGYADWEAGVLSSKEARNLGGEGRCERCGGRMGLAGKGLLKCDRCDHKVYL